MAKTDTAKLKDNIVRLFTSDDDDVPETSMSRLRETGGQLPEAPPQTATSVDLTDRHKLVMTFGAGRSGKTMLQRWVVERANIQRPDEPLTLVTLDAARATMKLFFQDVLAPGTVDGAMPYLERILTRVQKSPRSMVLDFPADMTLVPLARQIPDLNEQIEQAGMSVVALYLLTPRQTDLTVLDAMENVDFKPAATALILNLGTMDTSQGTRRPSMRRCAGIQPIAPLSSVALSKSGCLGIGSQANRGPFAIPPSSQGRDRSEHIRPVARISLASGDGGGLRPDPVMAAVTPNLAPPPIQQDPVVPLVEAITPGQPPTSQQPPIR